MRRTSNLFLLVLSICIIISNHILKADEGGETIVTLSTQVAPERVPLNRQATLTVRIEWEGDLDLIVIGDVEEPILTNFDIVGSSSTNRVSGTAEGRRAVKEIAYILQPRGLGMAYVEPVGLSYEDLRTGKTHSLMTQRVGVEAISPVAEPGEMPKWWIWAAAGIFMVGIFVFMLIRMSRLRNAEVVEIVVRIIEETYLEDLKTQVDLKTADRREGLTAVTKLFRKYLAEKHDISAMEATTAELVKALEEAGMDANLLKKCESLFEKADVVKFSGQEASQAEFEEAYTTVETILESHLAREKEVQAKAEAEAKAKKKIKLFGKN